MLGKNLIMRIILICLFVLLTISLAEAQKISLNKSFFESRAVLQTSAQLPVTLPAEFGSHIVLKAAINNQPADLILDIGSSYSLINLEQLNVFKLKSVKQPGNCYGAKRCYLGNLSVGKINLKDFPLLGFSGQLRARRASDGEFYAPVGLLGYDFIRRFVFEIDYPNKTIKIHDAANFRYTGENDGYCETLPLDLERDGTPNTEIKFTPVEGGTSFAARALIDTGSPDRKLLASTAFAPKFNKFKKSFDAELGIAFIDQVFQLQPAHSSPQSAENFDVLVGNPALSGYKVIVDYSRNRLILTMPRIAIESISSASDGNDQPVRLGNRLTDRFKNAIKTAEPEWDLTRDFRSKIGGGTLNWQNHAGQTLETSYQEFDTKTEAFDNFLSEAAKLLPPTGGSILTYDSVLGDERVTAAQLDDPKRDTLVFRKDKFVFVLSGSRREVTRFARLFLETITSAR